MATDTNSGDTREVGESSREAARHEERAENMFPPAPTAKGTSPIVYVAIRSIAKELAKLILKKVPDGKLRDAALQGLQQVIMLCDLALAGSA